MLHDPQWKIKHDAKQALLDAAQYLENHEWCQGALVSPSGRVCLFGAINAVAVCPGEMVLSEIVRRLRKLTPGDGPVKFNDTPGRTKQEVITLLKTAARQ